MLFQQRALQLIGKSVDKLLNDYGKNETPPEITSLVGQKFTFIIRVLSNKSIQKREPSFEVLMIKQRFGRQANIPAISKEENLRTTSTSTFELANLPPLVPIAINKMEIQHSPFESQLPEDIQYMEIDKTSTWGENENTNKRNFKDFEDNQQDSNDSNDDNTPLKQTKRTHSQGKSKQ